VLNRGGDAIRAFNSDLGARVAGSCKRKAVVAPASPHEPKRQLADTRPVEDGGSGRGEDRHRQHW